MQKIYLSAALDLSKTGITQGFLVPFTYEGLDRQTVRWRCADDGQVSHSRQRHIERAGDRCCGQGQDVNFRAQVLDAFFLTHAKTVFFIDNQQTKTFVLDGGLQQFMCTNHDVYGAVL